MTNSCCTYKLLDAVCFIFFYLFGSSAVNTLHWQVEAHLSQKHKSMTVCSLYISRTVHPICFIPTAMPALLMPNKVLANLRFSVNFSINPLQSLLSVQHFECAVLKKAACSVTRGQEIQQTQAPHWYNIKRKWTKWVTPWKTMWNMLRIWNVHTIIDKNPVKMLWRDRSFKSRRGPHVSENRKTLDSFLCTSQPLVTPRVCCGPVQQRHCKGILEDWCGPQPDRVDVSRPSSL